MYEVGTIPSNGFKSLKTQECNVVILSLCYCEISKCACIDHNFRFEW